MASCSNSLPAASTQTPPASSGLGKRIAVVYLARKAEGAAPLKRFFESYHRYPAEAQHDLIIIFKGFEDPEELRQFQATISLPYSSFTVSDEGFDITAYLKLAHALDYDYFCFLNTFTEIAAPAWLALLVESVTDPTVGIVGATGSFESIPSTLAAIEKVVWLCNEMSIEYDRGLAYYFDFIVSARCQRWLTLPWLTLPREKISLRKDWRAIEAKQFELIWSEMIKPGGGLSELSDFPPFPNPHIRSNGFITSRVHLLSWRPDAIQTKLDACRFESGRQSLTAQIRKQNLRALVVNRKGEAFDVRDWAASCTFRLGSQEGLILADNKTRDFEASSHGTRATLTRLSWGDYFGSPPPDFPDLGFNFARHSGEATCSIP